MPIPETISAFAISVAANIATGYLSHSSKTVKKEIEEAFEEVKIKNYSAEIRTSLSFKRKWDKIKSDITEKITSADDFNSLSEEVQHILESFKDALAARQGAYNYLKDITDSERYAREFQLLENLQIEIDNANQKLDRIELSPFLNKEDFLLQYPLRGKFLHNDYIDSVIEKLQNPEYKSIRFVALSGMGKTRIVREAFASTDSELFYCESSEDSRVKSVLRTIFTQSSNDSIVVLDNCSSPTFGEILLLKEECGAEQRIISINNDMREPQQRGVELIRIQSADLKEMVDEYIAERLGGWENENFRRIADFADGIPYMAILLCDALLQNDRLAGHIDNDTIFHKLLGIDRADQDATDDKKVLEACSLFMPLGYSEQYACQSDFVAVNDYLIDLQGSEGARKRKFRKVCDKYIGRQLMEHLSGHINVRPMPLAIWLASEWFRGCTKDDILSLVTDISKIPSDGHNHAKYMQEAFCKRLEYLTENRVAREVLTELMRPGAPFAHEEILNTAMGSRFLLSFSNVIPEVVANTLFDIYSEYDVEKLRSVLIDDARRNFVYVLEKICYNKACFYKAALVLARLALAENETWSNNSIGLFRQLFHILIPGTEANLQDRFEVIRTCTSRGREYIDLALTAIDSALAVDGYMRIGGAERQGFAVYKDYQPTYSEIYEYWEACKNLLIKITEEYSEKLDKIAAIVENHIYDFLKVNHPDILYELLDYYIPKKQYDWGKVLKTLNRISTDAEFYDFDKKKLDNYIKNLTKTDFYSRFIAVQEKETGFRRPFEETQSIMKQQYETLAEEYVDEHWSDISILQKFYANDFTFATVFAIKICTLEKGDDRKRDFFIDHSINILTENPNSKGKSLFIYYCSAIDDSKDLETIVTKISETQAYPILFATIGACYPKLEARFYKGLLDLVSDGKSDANNFNEFFSYLPYSIDLSLRLKIYEEIAALGTPVRMALLNNIQWIVHNKAYQALPGFVRFIERYIKALLMDDSAKEMHFRDIIDMAEAYLTAFNKPKFARFVHRKLLECLKTDAGYNAEMIYHTLLMKYKNEIWPELSEALLEDQDKFIVYFRLCHILGAHLGLRSGLLFDTYDEDFLIQWCKENAPIAPQRLASMIPVYQSDGLEHFSSIMMKLLDLFGDDEEVLSNLNCNMGTFSCTGSVIPLLRTRLSALRELVNHKHYTVIRWAKQLAETTELEIKREQDKEDFDRLVRG